MTTDATYDANGAPGSLLIGLWLIGNSIYLIVS
jgi:hypothetical protein